MSAIEEKVAGQKIDQTKCGFICILGTPNVGKSTLINTLIGQKIAAVTHKRQTTRGPIRGILSEKETQIIFVDTPGVFSPQKPFDTSMVRAAWKSAKESDIVLVLLDANRSLSDQEVFILTRIREEKFSKKPIFFALNKIDLVKQDDILSFMSNLQHMGFHDNIFPICARTGKGLTTLKAHMSAQLPSSVWLYPSQMHADQSQALQASEITREKILLLCHNEIPYQLTVETERFEKKKHEIMIQQIIYVMRRGHKRIIIGQNGEKIKQIGSKARLELEELFKCRIHLFLYVKIDPKWDTKKEHYEIIGLQTPKS